MRALSPLSDALALTAAAALLVTLSACGGGDDSDGGDGGDGAEGGDAAETTSLSFELVEETFADGFPDEECAYGEFAENSTGVTGDQADAVEFFRQYDCYSSEENVGGFPDLIQQVLYVEFADEASATSYAEEQAVLYRTITDGTNVVVLGTGADQDTMNAYGDTLLEECSECSEVAGS